MARKKRQSKHFERNQLGLKDSVSAQAHEGSAKEAIEWHIKRFRFFQNGRDSAQRSESKYSAVRRSSVEASSPVSAAPRPPGARRARKDDTLRQGRIVRFRTRDTHGRFVNVEPAELTRSRSNRSCSIKARFGRAFLQPTSANLRQKSFFLLL
jgi:hypothetical protein